MIVPPHNHAHRHAEQRSPSCVDFPRLPRPPAGRLVVEITSRPASPSGVFIMWHRTAAALFLIAAAMTASAQVNSVYSRAVPPDKSAMERLNLKIEWTAYIPVEGRAIHSRKSRPLTTRSSSRLAPDC